MVSNLIISKTLLYADSMVLLRELKLIAPDIWDGKNRCLILPQRLGDLEEPSYIECLQRVIEKLNEYDSMLDDGIITEVEYDGKKWELLNESRIENFH